MFENGSIWEQPTHVNKAYFEATMIMMMMMMMMIIIIIIITINFKMSSPHSKMLKAEYKIIFPTVCMDTKLPLGDNPIAVYYYYYYYYYYYLLL